MVKVTAPKIGATIYEGASVSLRKQFLENCNLNTVLDCPDGTFLGTGVNTVVLLCEKGAATKNVSVCQLEPGRIMSKTNPLNDAARAYSGKSWSVDEASFDVPTIDLSFKQPRPDPFEVADFTCKRLAK